jgi:hypothetical protein
MLPPSVAGASDPAAPVAAAGAVAPPSMFVSSVAAAAAGAAGFSLGGNLSKKLFKSSPSSIVNLSLIKSSFGPEVAFILLIGVNNSLADLPPPSDDDWVVVVLSSVGLGGTCAIKEAERIALILFGPTVAIEVLRVERSLSCCRVSRRAFNPCMISSSREAVWEDVRKNT